MSSDEYVALRSIHGLATTAKAGLLADREHRRLLFWIQGRSQTPGGLAGIARDLAEKFPDRLITPTMAKLKLKSGTMVTGPDLARIRDECEYFTRDQLAARRACVPYSAPESAGVAELTALCRRAFLEKLPAHLVQLCVNPHLQLAHDPGSPDTGYQREVAGQLRPVDGGSREEFRSAEVLCFKELVTSLLALMHGDCQRAQAAHALTTVGQTVWKQLDFCKRTHEMVVIEGREGIGKSEAVKAWCAAHEGECRYIELTSTTNQTEFFRELAAVLGVACSYTRKAMEMKSRSTDVLRRSRLMLVVDEGHYLLPQTQRVETRPVLLDWLYSSLNNKGVPVAIIATPQFSQLAAHVEQRTGWNSRQFLRRSKRFQELPQRLGINDLKLVAGALLPGASEALVGVVAAYGDLKEHQLDAVKDLVREARLIAEEDGRERLKTTDLERAMKEVIEPTLLAKLRASCGNKAGRPQARGRRAADSRPQPGSATEPDTSIAILPAPRRGTAPATDLEPNRFSDASALAG